MQRDVTADAEIGSESTKKFGKKLVLDNVSVSIERARPRYHRSSGSADGPR
jgi:hypothetical protein